MEFYITSFIILLFLSGFFASTELAILTVPMHKIETLVREGKFGAKTLKYLKINSDRFLITGLIGNDLVNTTIAALATKLSMEIALEVGFGQSLAVGISTGIATFIILMFGEIIPKSYAVKNSVFLALKTAHIYRVLLYILFPIVVSIEVIVKFFTGETKTTKITDDEMKTFIDMSKKSGTIDNDEYKNLKNMLEFNNKIAEEIMVPRVQIKALDEETTIKEAFEFYIKNSYSRIPIYSGNIDKIDYFFTVRDLIKARENHLLDLKLKNLETLKKVIKVPLNQPIDSILKLFQKSYKHIAVVMDEYGGVAGIVTVEDIMEEIFGEIRDETDIGEIDKIRKTANDVYLIDPSIITIDDILDEYALNFDDVGINESEFSGEKVSYIITDKFERFPDVGEILTFKINRLSALSSDKKEILQFKITKKSDKKIDEVEVSKKSL